MKEKLKKIITFLILLSVVLLSISVVINIYRHNHEDFKDRPGVVEVSAEPEIDVDEIVDPMIENTIPAPEIYVTKFSTTKLNIRTGPGLNFDIVKTVNINTELQMLEGSEENDWVIIKLDEVKYYVNSKYLSNEKTVIKSVTTSRSAAPKAKSVKTAVKEQSTTAAASNCVGYYTLTYYCSCSKCCGKTNGITAWGTKATPGRTIATSSKFAFGTRLVINGHEYTVEDRGRCNPRK